MDYLAVWWQFVITDQEFYKLEEWISERGGRILGTFWMCMEKEDDVLWIIRWEIPEEGVEVPIFIVATSWLYHLSRPGLGSDCITIHLVVTILKRVVDHVNEHP